MVAVEMHNYQIQLRHIIFVPNAFCVAFMYR